MATQKSEAWKRLEEHVARLYESLGYVTVMNSSIGGQQIDLIAEKFLMGIGKSRLYIECKYHERRSVSNQDIYEFKTTYGNLRQEGGFTNGILITNSGFSKDARAAADATAFCGPIHIRTLSALEDEVLNLSESLHGFVHDYESTPVANIYVPLEANGILPHSMTKFIENIEEAIQLVLAAHRDVSEKALIGKNVIRKDVIHYHETH